MKNRLADCFFYIGIICELLAAPSGYMLGGYHEKYIILAGIVFFSLSLAFSMNIKKDWKVFLPLFAYALVCYYVQRSALILRLVLIILAGRRQERRRLVKVFFYGTAFTLLLGIVLSVSGHGNPLYMEESFRHVAERRYSFGFYHPNSFMLFWAKLVILGMYIYGKDIKPLFGTGLFILSAIPAFLAGSKIGMGVLLMAFIIWLYLRLDKNSERSSRLLYYGGGAAIAAELLLVFSLPLLPYPVEYDDNVPGLWQFMNELTTGRLRFTKKLLNAQSFSFLGSRQFGNMSEIGFIDSMYREGLLFVIIYVIILLWLWRRLHREKDVWGLALVLLFTFYAFAESFLVYLNKNAVWLMLMGGLPAFLSGTATEVGDEKKAAH